MRPPYEHLVAACLLGRLHDLLVAAGVVVDAVGERVPDVGKPGMIVSRLQEWQCGETKFLGFDGSAFAGPEPHLCRKRARVRSAGCIRIGIGPSRSLFEEGSRVTCGGVAHRKRDLQMNIRLFDKFHGTS